MAGDYAGNLQFYRVNLAKLLSSDPSPVFCKQIVECSHFCGFFHNFQFFDEEITWEKEFCGRLSEEKTRIKFFWDNFLKGNEIKIFLENFSRVDKN